MSHKPHEQKTDFVGNGSVREHDLDTIANMLKYAAEYNLEKEVVLALCCTIKAQPDIDLFRATYEALAKWDL